MLSRLVPYLVENTRNFPETETKGEEEKKKKSDFFFPAMVRPK
jgi:hypothetical protein